MKKILTFLFLAGFLCLLTEPIVPQEEEKDIKKEIRREMPPRTAPTYRPAGRKDPFRDLLAGRQAERKATPSGRPEIFIEDLGLIGIVKARGKFTAIVTGPQEFPLFVNVGHKFSDGFVLSITDTKVTFRKTRERGFPLFRPRDIVIEIHPEER